MIAKPASAYDQQLVPQNEPATVASTSASLIVSGEASRRA